LHFLIIPGLQESIIEGAFQKGRFIKPVPVEDENIHPMICGRINPFFHHLRIVVHLIPPEGNFGLVVTRESGSPFPYDFPFAGPLGPEHFGIALLIVAGWPNIRGHVIRRIFGHGMILLLTESQSGKGSQQDTCNFSNRKDSLHGIHHVLVHPEFTQYIQCPEGHAEIVTIVYLACMIEQGCLCELRIQKRSGVGLFLSDESGEEVLLPNKYCTDEMKPGDQIRVFIYRDSEGRKVATTLKPKILLHEFSLLKVSAVTRVGAFLDWGLEKDLMVPFREQKQKMEEGRWYLVYLDLDQKTDRLFASNRLERYIQNDELTVKEGEEVNLVILQKTDLGYAVIINHLHKGLIFDNEVFQELRIGERLKGFVKKVRDDHKIDVSLQPVGYKEAHDANSELILNQLKASKGFLPLTDKSSPRDISLQLGISKKAFKKTIGALYKQRLIEIRPEGIALISQAMR